MAEAPNISRFIRESLQISGEVIEIEAIDRRIDDDGTCYAPIVRYTAAIWKAAFSG